MEKFTVANESIREAHKKSNEGNTELIETYEKQIELFQISEKKSNEVEDILRKKLDKMNESLKFKNEPKEKKDNSRI